MTPDVRRSTAAARWRVRRLRRLPGRLVRAVCRLWGWASARRLRPTYRLLDVQPDPKRRPHSNDLLVTVGIFRGEVEEHRFQLVGRPTCLRYVSDGQWCLGERDNIIQALLAAWEREHRGRR